MDKSNFSSREPVIFLRAGFGAALMDNYEEVSL